MASSSHAFCDQLNLAGTGAAELVVRKVGSMERAFGRLSKQPGSDGLVVMLSSTVAEIGGAAVGTFSAMDAGQQKAEAQALKRGRVW